MSNVKQTVKSSEEEDGKKIKVNEGQIGRERQNMTMNNNQETHDEQKEREWIEIK